MDNKQYYIDFYCKECQLGLKVVLICGVITCPSCKSIVYTCKKEK